MAFGRAWRGKKAANILGLHDTSLFGRPILDGADAQYHQATIADVQANPVRYQDVVVPLAALRGGWWNREREHLAAAESAGR